MMGKSKMNTLKKAAAKTAKFGSAYFVSKTKYNKDEQLHATN